MRKTLSLITIIILFASCSVQKRKYQDGYYVHHHHKAKHRVHQNAESNARIVSSGDVVNPDQMNASAVAADGNTPFFVSSRPKNVPSDSCDVLIFKDGSELLALVREISIDEIKYHRCEDKGGPVYVSKKADLFMVKYADGRKEVMPAKEEPSPVYRDNKRSQPTYAQPIRGQELVNEPKAGLSLIMGILSILSFLVMLFAPLGLLGLLLFPSTIVLGILAISFGLSARRKIRNDPYRILGARKASAGITLGIISLSLMTLLLILVILLIALFI